jgi:hypothetical protein
MKCTMKERTIANAQGSDAAQYGGTTAAALSTPVYSRLVPCPILHCASCISDFCIVHRALCIAIDW